MNKIKIIWLLIFCPIFGFGQLINEVNMDFGFNVNTYDIKNKVGFSNTISSEEISMFINVNARKYVTERFSYSVGIGINKEYIDFNPLINVGETNRNEISNFDTLTIAEVGNWDWQFQLPITISLELFDQIDIFPPIFIVPGMRLTTGLTNRITFNRINTDNIIISNFNEEMGYGYEYYDEKLNNDISKYYSEQIKHYRLMMNVGIEFFFEYNTIGFLGGVRYNRYILSPIDGAIKNKFSMIGYIGIYYEINNR